MSAEFWFGTEVFLNGLMAGVMYSLVALGFVLIFKASGIFNYSQGVMALFAAQTLVGLQTGQVPFSHLINAVLETEVGMLFGLYTVSLLSVVLAVALLLIMIYMARRELPALAKLSALGKFAVWVVAPIIGVFVVSAIFDAMMGSLIATKVHHFGWNVPTLVAILLSLGVMILFAIAVETLVLKHLVNQEPIILFMATIGLAYFMEGFGELMWGSEIKTLDIGIEQGGNVWVEEATSGLGGEDFYGFYLDTLDIYATVIAILLVTSLVLFSQYTKTGRALRAVADDHQAALSVGISLRTIWVIVWSIAGFVALVAGAMWGAKSGVQFSLSLIALKALPVLMLGGFTSIPGAIIGGLIIGVGEKMFEFLIGAPFLGGATENWFAYMLALLFLVFRPQGLFGEKIIERV